MDRLLWLESDLTSEQIAETSQATLGVALHPLALEHLSDSSLSLQFPFPRLEKHESYLFGTLLVPSNIQNPSADFDALVFAVTHDAVVATVFCHPTSERDWQADRETLFAIDTTDSTPDGGQFILNCLQLVMHEITSDANAILGYLQKSSDDVHDVIDLKRNLGDLSEGTSLSSKARRSLLAEINALLPIAQGISSEIPTIRRVVIETSSILDALASDDEKVDLHHDHANTQRELFSRSLEIYLMDLLVQSRQVLGILGDIESLTKGIADRSTQLAEEESVAAGRFTGAIASIMLLPTFIVGLYGQNFAKMPETNWAYGYLFSWGAIVALTVFQVWFFRRRRWL